MSERDFTLDPRTTAARPDLAADHLRGRVAAARFVAGTVREVVDAQAPVRREPRPDALLDTEALRGELVTVYDEDGEGWCWGQLHGDRYVGWLPANALQAPGPPPTHRVAVLRTLEFPGRSIKAPPLAALSQGSRVAVASSPHDTEQPDTSGNSGRTGGGDAGLVRLANGSYVPARHLAPTDSSAEDFVAVAESFVGVPYLWGGKTSLGIDCSGLVQVALAAAGIECPRDSDMQDRAFVSNPAGDLAAPRRGDLVFWKGHVAIIRDQRSLVHANAFHMAVTIELIAEAVRRIREVGSEITAVRSIGLC
jgi:cell wall-associated NlpC family hydrolase